MIDFSGYTYAEILQQMLDRVDNSLDKREGSLIQTALAPGAWYLEGLALTLNQVQQAAYVTTATGQDLDYLTLNRGITRIAATVAVRKGVFNVQVPEGTIFKTINGENSVQFESGAYIGSESGNFTYRMTCQTAGEIGNSYSGNIIPVTSFAGSTDLTTAYIGEIIVPGTNEETDEALRSRFIASLDAAPYGGNISEYRQAILAIAGVGGVQVYPANYYNGGGTVLCSIVDSNFAPASAGLVKTVQDSICPPEDGSSAPSPSGYGIAPIGAAVTITSATGVTVNVSATITFSASTEDGLSTYGDEIKQAVSDYITSVAEDWGKALQGNTVSYSSTVYVARVIAAILSVPEVTNVSNLLINGSAGDLVLTESATLQQIPVMGEVTLNG